MAEDMDNPHDFENQKTSRVLPIGWQLLFWGLIIWGIYYTLSYTPSLSGWSQEKEYTESLKR